MKTIPLILFSIGLAVTGQIFLKIGMDEIGKVELSQFLSLIMKVLTSPILIIGLLFYAVSAVLWMMVLSQVNLSYAYPFLGLTYVAMLFLTKFFLQEQISTWRWLGTALIFLGVLVSAKQ